MKNEQTAFTLIELLVVVSIIVLLLSLLAPAMDRAIYTAEMAQCAAQQDGVGVGAGLYAMENDRKYPYRAASYDVNNVSNLTPHVLAVPTGRHNTGPRDYDDRPMLRQYFSMKALSDPFGSGDVDFDTTQRSMPHASFSLWFGFKYNTIGTGAIKFSTPWNVTRKHAFTGDLITTKSNILLGDHLGYIWGYSYSGHSDKQGSLGEQHRQDEPFGGPADHNVVLSWWFGTGIDTKLDLQFTYMDGSVQRFDDVPNNPIWYADALRKEDRFTATGFFSDNSAEYIGTDQTWLAIPKQ